MREKENILASERKQNAVKRLPVNKYLRVHFSITFTSVSISIAFYIDWNERNLKYVLKGIDLDFLLCVLNNVKVPIVNVN